MAFCYSHIYRHDLARIVHSKIHNTQSLMLLVMDGVKSYYSFHMLATYANPVIVLSVFIGCESLCHLCRFAEHSQVPDEMTVSVLQCLCFKAAKLSRLRKGRFMLPMQM